MSKEAKTNAMRFLETHKVAYRAVGSASEEFVDGITTALKNNQPLEQSFKTIVCVGKPRCYYVFSVPVAEEIDLKKAAKLVGEKAVELLPVKELFALTGYVRGGCTIIGMKKQFPTVIHQSALDFSTIFISGGRIGVHLEIPPQEVAALIGAKFGDILK